MIWSVTCKRLFDEQRRNIWASTFSRGGCFLAGYPTPSVVAEQVFGRFSDTNVGFISFSLNRIALMVSDPTTS